MRQTELFGVLLIVCGIICLVKPDFLLISESNVTLLGLNVLGVSFLLMASLLRGLSYTILSTIHYQSVMHINIITGVITVLISFILIPILGMTISKMNKFDFIKLAALGVANTIS